MALGSPTTVVLELMTMGQKSAAHLGELLRAASPPTAFPTEHQELAAEILHCCERVIVALSGAAAADGKKRKAAMEPLPAAKRRVRGGEALMEVKSSTTHDGFIWRKYGQKDINGCKHPRLYYRCAYRDQGCTATRRLQRSPSPEEPAAYVITYYGEHTCRDGAVGREAAARPPAVVDLGVNHCGRADADADDRSRGSPMQLPWFSAEQRCRDGEAPGETSKRWSWLSPSSSSEPEVDQETWGLAVAGDDEPGYDAASSGLEFLDEYCFDDWEWEPAMNSLGLGDLDLHDDVATFVDGLNLA